MIETQNTKLDIRNLTHQAVLFRRRLDAVQASLTNPGFDWYPYDSLGSFLVLADLLRGENQFLLDLIGDQPVLDIGCGDGHISFFLESLGCQVIALDNPQTNFNQMRGVKALKAALHSTIEIHEQDIDYNFRLPDTQCGVTFLLGVLYHLKNPFSVLETLSTRSRWCILSTRVARFTPRKTADLGEFPLAYLVNPTETNNDSTNYWIFTNPGLKRLIERTGWRVVDYITVGNTKDSDPVTAQGDERAFCLAERTGAPITNGRLVSGWHEQECFESWRWTEKNFSAAFNDVAAGEPHVVRLEFFLPDATAQEEVELGGSINGHELPKKTFTQPGHYRYEQPVPDSALITKPVVVEFRLNKALPPSDQDRRELGIVVSSIRLL